MDLLEDVLNLSTEEIVKKHFTLDDCFRYNLFKLISINWDLLSDCNCSESDSFVGSDICNKKDGNCDN